MQRPRFQITVRSLMVAVAVAGLLLGAFSWLLQMRFQSATYRKRAFEFGAMSVRAAGSNVYTKSGAMVDIYESEYDRIKDKWAYDLAEKYWRLADRPWLSVEADPPPPKPLARSRMTVDLSAELRSWHWYREPVYPWWTVLWTWRRERFTVRNYSRWSFL